MWLKRDTEPLIPKAARPRRGWEPLGFPSDRYSYPSGSSFVLEPPREDVDKLLQLLDAAASQEEDFIAFLFFLIENFFFNHFTENIKASRDQVGRNGVRTTLPDVKKHICFLLKQWELG